MTSSPDDIHVVLRAKVRQSVMEPGVYLMKGASGKILYVGKAKNLKKRLASYFLKTGPADIKTRTLLRRVVDYETIVTGSEKEALLLESNLIKRHRPRYNVILKDDKRYPVLRFDLNHPFPNLTIVRKIGQDGAAYFGPYASAHAVRETLKFINKQFRLRKCKNREFSQRTRPCLHHQMDACYGPCCLEVDRQFYGGIVDEVILFLKGRTPELIRKIRREMDAAVNRLAFEEAAQHRDRIQALETTLERQRAISNDLQDRDIISIAEDDQFAMANILSIRSGYLQSSRNFVLTETLADRSERLSGFLRQSYPEGVQCPRELLVSLMPSDVSLLEGWFQDVHNQRVKIVFPQRGEKKRLLEMGMQNAEKALQEQAAATTQRSAVLDLISKRLRMKNRPMRIECFDNSNLFGKSAVAGMVVFEDGQPNPSAYRKFSVRSVAKPDDYTAMNEILTRRFTNHADWPHPDLLLLDGGKGQLNIALDVIRRLQLDGCFDVAAIAKKEIDRGESQDKIYIPNRANPIHFTMEDRALLFLQHIRDEAHRFALSFHRKKRAKAAFQSQLDKIPGIGPKRKRTLLAHFRGINAIRAATLEELSALPGMNRNTARAVLDGLAKDDS